MDPADFLDGGTVTVAPEPFSVLRTDRPVPAAFATIDDGAEITVVAETGTVSDAVVLAAADGWRLFTFEMTLPFELVGFLAAVATALARENVSVFALSAYSTDHVLVRESDVDRAIRTLETLGCTVDT